MVRTLTLFPFFNHQPNSGTDVLILKAKVSLSVCIGGGNQYFVQDLHFKKLRRSTLIEYDEILSSGLLSLK